ncbi:MAG TPA: lysylphosphatidylglycerol synthase domain-containing protein, partial [Anaerolineales bacterium]|nr:lysylphosphatidylglycerol synthase domain-containing protein [Anaerolineales bacterium]
FHNSFGIETLLASFSVSYLFIIASITPSGVGFVEGAMVLTQNAMGVDPLTSTAIALAYRGITFWLTLAYGFFAIRVIGFQPNEPSTNEAAPD